MGLPADTRSWLAVKASDLGASLTGLEGILEGMLSQVGLKLNQASGFADSMAMTGAASVLNWTSIAIDTNDDGTADSNVIAPATSLPMGAMPGDLDIAGDGDFSGKIFKVNGMLTNLNILGLISGSASFGLTIQEVDVDLTGGDSDSTGTAFDDTGDLQNAQLLQFGLDVTNVKVGVSGVGVEIPSGSIGVATLTPERPAMGTVTDTRSWLAVKASGLGATLTGLESVLTASLSNVGLKLNQASGFENATTMTGAATVVDWNAITFDTDNDGTLNMNVVDPAAALPMGAMPGDLAIVTDTDFQAELFQVNGSLDELSVLGFVNAKAQFALTVKKVDVDVDGDGVFNPAGGVDLKDAGLTTLVIDNAQIFVGVDGNTDGTAGDGIGFAATGGSVALATLKPGPEAVMAGDTRSFLGLKAGVATAGFAGLDPDILSATASDVEVELNNASGSVAGSLTPAAALNWTKAFDLDGNDTFGESADLLDPGLDLDPPASAGDLAIDFTGDLLRAKGSIELQAVGFAYVRGGFSFEKRTVDVKVGTETINDASLLQLGISIDNAFVGVNGPYRTDPGGDMVFGGLPGSTDDTLSTEALGLDVTGGNLLVGVLKAPVPQSGPADTRGWTGITATLDTVSFVGLDSLEASGSNISVAINNAKG